MKSPEIEQTLAKLDQLTEEEKIHFYKDLEDHINWMINNEFEKLVQLLYRVDVDEQKLKALLNEGGDNAAAIISTMIIERQLQKLKAQKQQGFVGNIPEEESW